MAKVRRAPGLGASVNDAGSLAYDCAPTVTWVKDASQILVVQREGERCWSLQGVEAVIWDLLTLRYGFAKMVDFLAVLSEDSREAAASTLLATVRHWEEEGIVIANCEGQDG